MTDALYRSICFSPLEKVPPIQREYDFFGLYTNELLICISFEKCSTPSTDYTTKTTWAFCTYFCCLQVPHSIISLQRSNCKSYVGASNWHFSCKLGMISFKNTCTSSASISAFTNNTPKNPDSGQEQEGKNLTFSKHCSMLLFFLFSPDISGTTDLIHHCFNPTRQFPHSLLL